MKVNWKDLLISGLFGLVLSSLFYFVLHIMPPLGQTIFFPHIWLSISVILAYYFYCNKSNIKMAILVSLISGILLSLVPMFYVMQIYYEANNIAEPASNRTINLLSSMSFNTGQMIQIIIYILFVYLISSLILGLIIWFLTNKFIHKNGDVK